MIANLHKLEASVSGTQSEVNLNLSYFSNNAHLWLNYRQPVKYKEHNR